MLPCRENPDEKIFIKFLNFWNLRPQIFFLQFNIYLKKKTQSAHNNLDINSQFTSYLVKLKYWL